jgi:beta-glucosidase
MKKLSLVLLLISLMCKLIAQDLNYTNTDLPFEQRAELLVGQMSLNEKISQMMDVAPAIPRLGIPVYNWWSEGLHGVARAGYATVFPQAIGLAAMWNDSLHYKVATVISTEFRAKYNESIKNDDRARYKGLTVWSPNINIFRDPRWGRGQETYGEDPYLTSRYGVAFVKGLQGNNPKYLKTVATPKHYMVHSGPEKLRHVFDINVSEHDLLETYSYAFEACIREGKAYSIMGAYNRFRGKSCSGSDTLLNILLRKKWGFNGFVVSDCDAVGDIYYTHKITKSPAEAAAIGVKSGCDLDCGFFYQNLKNAVDSGYIKESEIDIAVRRLMLARMKLGMFEPKGAVPYDTLSSASNDTKANRALALTSAQQSMVLLKNNGVLPFNKKTLMKIAVIGPNSNNAEVMYGNYNGIPSKAVTPYEGIKNILLPKTKLYYNNLNGLVNLMPELGQIPASCIESNGKPGLKAEIFDNLNFEGTPVLFFNDTLINYTWDSQSPFAKVKAKNISIRWTGQMKIPTTGEYGLGFTGDDGYKVWIDGKLVFNEWRQQAPYSVYKTFNWKENEKHDIKIEFYQAEGGAEASLKFSKFDPNAEEKVIEQAKQCDVIVYVGGISPNLEGEEMDVPFEGFDGGDRVSINLPAIQTQMLKKLKKTGKPVVLVLMSGSALAIPWEAENLDAILQAWYPGEEGGTAIANILFGNYNPGGKLPVTVYKSIDQLPPFTNYDMNNRTYRYFKGEPLYQFGYGLSYTKFTYSGLEVPSMAKTNEKVKIKVTVLNSGTKEGDEVVQVYVKHPTVSVPVPIHSLKGFKRVSLKAGERKTLEFVFDTKDLAILDKDNKWFVHPGDIDFYVGGQQPSKALLKENKVLLGTITMTGENFYLGE